MKKSNKQFDAVEFMHEQALRIYEETKGMTREEELAHWKERENISFESSAEPDEGDERA